MPTLFTMPGKTPLSLDAYPASEAYRVRMESDEGVAQAPARPSMEPVA
jgi:hypothetical protein